MLTILKYAIGVLLGLGLNRLFGPMGILGLTPLAVITAVTNSNGAIYTVLLSNGLAMLLPFNGFVLGANTSLFTIAKAGAGGIVLGLITVLFTGILTYYLYSLIRRKPDPMGMAIGTTGGNAVAVPASVAMADPSLEPVVGVATAQVAGAVVITAILTPILTGFFAKRAAKKQQK